ncbi:precorrin-2 dehydrogenase/sirohydrochlorin ferrochelatase family protein [Ferrimonas senticii]|uniref:precorrin-2 dehydrogenase/sirohydrochlorin ferrochelatase family protein n=1 Tax=Ferrimonas senticii TaxID=394566 RepID=UPI0003FD926F|nr:bifunctional precorrin-2 dehydrogenase/sirohydrochlorin ferrochelatase [Ferrimonas senticii]
MRYFPLFHDTHNLHILVVGGGEVAARKLALWSRTEARLEAVSPTWVDAIVDLHNPNLTLVSKYYSPEMLQGKQGVIAATDDGELNRAIAREAKALGLWVNVVDQPQLCSVITPAIVDRSPMVIAIGSEGSAPVLVRTLRGYLEARLPRSLGKLAQFIGEQRQRVMTANDNPRGVWERFIERNGLALTERSEQLLTQALAGVSSSGQLWLTHQGRDPALLPIAAMAELQRLDRVITDDLAPMMADLVRRDASIERLSGLKLTQLSHWLQQGEQLLLVTSEADYPVLIERLSQQQITPRDPYQPL